MKNIVKNIVKNLLLMNPNFGVKIKHDHKILVKKKTLWLAFIYRLNAGMVLNVYYLLKWFFSMICICKEIFIVYYTFIHYRDLYIIQFLPPVSH